MGSAWSSRGPDVGVSAAPLFTGNVVSGASGVCWKTTKALTLHKILSLTMQRDTVLTRNGCAKLITSRRQFKSGVLHLGFSIYALYDAADRRERPR